MAEFTFNEISRCGYCCQEFNSKTDTKELPCHHVFCLPCLQADYREGYIRCITCQSVHTTEISDLPPAKLSQTASSKASTTLHCDCYDCDNQQAVFYCLQCAKCLCDNHQQMHSGFFGEEHQLISSADYLLSPGKYKGVICPHHNDKLGLVCKECSQLFCLKCVTFQTKCPDESCGHNFTSFDTMREEITLQVDMLLSKANEILTEICRLDKKIWKSLDEGEVRCKEMVEMIERVRNEQIEMIKEESENLKKLVHDYQRKLTNEVEAYNSELMAKKEQLEDTRTKVERWLREGHVTEQIKQRPEMTDELVKKTDVELNCQLSGKLVLFPKEEKSGLDILTITIPSALTFNNKQRINSTCYSVCHRPDGSLLVGHGNGVALVGGDNSTNSLTNMSGCVAATEHNGTVYVLRFVINTKCVVEKCSPEFTQRHQLFGFVTKGNIMTFLAASDTYVVATNPGCKLLVIYDIISKQTTNISVDVKPSAVSFISNTDLVVTHSSTKQLVRYHIEKRELKVVWRCENVGGLGVCVDGGLIYVSSYDKQTVYIITLQGENLQELKLDSLPAKVGQISVKGDELAVPGWDDEHVHLFRLHR